MCKKKKLLSTVEVANRPPHMNTQVAKLSLIFFMSAGGFRQSLHIIVWITPSLRFILYCRNLIGQL
jgi:hypothetical protein